jgi:hypothetical protein
MSQRWDERIQKRTPGVDTRWRGLSLGDKHLMHGTKSPKKRTPPISLLLAYAAVLTIAEGRPVVDAAGSAIRARRRAGRGRCLACKGGQIAGLVRLASGTQVIVAVSELMGGHAPSFLQWTGSNGTEPHAGTSAKTWERRRRPCRNLRRAGRHWLCLKLDNGAALRRALLEGCWHSGPTGPFRN